MRFDEFQGVLRVERVDGLVLRLIPIRERVRVICTLNASRPGVTQGSLGIRVDSDGLLRG